jgi:hypothetical protein
MYSLVSAYGVGYSQDSKWGSVDLTGLTVNEIFNNYRELFLTLSNPYLSEEVVVNFDIFRLEYFNYTDSLDNLFVELGDTALPTVDNPPVFETRWAIYGDAFSQGYKVSMNVPGQPPDGLSGRDEKTEVCIRRDRTDPELIYKHCMISLNGYFYRTDHDRNYTYIMNGGKSLLRSRRNQIGILSFQNVCEIEQIPITVDNLFKTSDDSKYFNEVILRLDRNFNDKSLILCLAGYLVFPDNNVLKQINETDWLLNTSGIPIFERYFESRDMIDYSSLELTEFANNPDRISVEEFMTDEVMERYLTHEQSFFVVLDTPRLIRTTNYIRHSKLPGMFTAYEEPKSLLFVGRGRTAEYWKTYEDGQWAVNVVDSYMPNRTFDSVNEKNRHTNAGTDTPYRLYYDSRAFLMNLGADVLVNGEMPDTKDPNRLRLLATPVEP